MYNRYDRDFARIYERDWTEFIVDLPPLIHSYISKYINRDNPEDIRILDLGCGTGIIDRDLAEIGYLVTGIDKSSAMIELARKNNMNNKNEFIEGDMRELSDIIDKNIRDDKKFDVVISIFDTLNHLKNFEELMKVVKDVYNALNHGGLFIFDVNTEKGLKKWDFINYEDYEDCTYILHGEYNYKEKRAYSYIIGFIKEGNYYRKFNETIYNTVFSINDIIQLFNNWNIEILDDNMEYTDNPENEDRIFIIANKH